MTRTRRTVNLEDDLHARAHAVLARLPGTPSLSSLINDLLAQTIPTLEQVVDAYEDTGTDGARRVVAEALGDAFLLGMTSQQRKENGTT